MPDILDDIDAILGETNKPQTGDILNDIEAVLGKAAPPPPDQPDPEMDAIAASMLSGRRSNVPALAGENLPDSGLSQARLEDPSTPPAERMELARQRQQERPTTNLDRLAKLAEYMPFIGGAAQAKGNIDIAAAAARIRDNPEKATYDDYDRVAAFVLGNEADAKKGFWGKVGDLVARMPGFMVEFAATGGAAAVGRAGASRVLGSAAEGIAGRVATGAAGAAVRTLATPTLIAESATERRLPGITRDENGNYWAEPVTEGVGESIARGTLDSFVELASESTGGALAKLTGWKKLTGALANRLPLLKTTPIGQSVRTVLKEAGYDGPVPEVMEEWLASAVRSLSGNQPLDATLQTLKDTPVLLTAFSIPFAGRKAIDVAGNALAGRQPSEATPEPSEAPQAAGTVQDEATEEAETPPPAEEAEPFTPSYEPGERVEWQGGDGQRYAGEVTTEDESGVHVRPDKGPPFVAKPDELEPPAPEQPPAETPDTEVPSHKPDVPPVDGADSPHVLQPKDGADGLNSSKHGSQTTSGTAPGEQSPGAESVPSGDMAQQARDLSMPLNSGPGRIPPAPIKGGAPRKLNEIIGEMEKIVDRPIVPGKMSRPGVAGVFKPSFNVSILRHANDLDTALHEISHALDDVDAIGAKWSAPGVRSPYDGELEKFWWHGSSTKSGPRSKLSYKRGEGIAEYFRARMVNPAEAAKAAPLFTAYVNGLLSPERLAVIERVGNLVREWAGQSSVDQTLSIIEEPKDGPAEQVKALFKKEGMEFTWGAWDKTRRQMTDRMWAFVKAIQFAKNLRGLEDILPQNDPHVLMRLNAGVNGKIEDMLANGWTTARGTRSTGGLSWIVAPLRGQKRADVESDLRLAKALLLSDRVEEETETLADLAKRLIMAEQQRIMAVMAGDAQTAGALAGTIEDLRIRLQYRGPIKKVLKYVQQRGDRMSGAGGGIISDAEQAKRTIAEIDALPAEQRDRVKEVAGRVREAYRSLLRYMRDKGRITPAQYDAMAQKDNYVSFRRAIEDLSPVPKMVKGTARVKELLQRFYGSQRMIQDFTTSLIEDTIKVVNESDRNEILRSFADMFNAPRGMHDGEALPLGEVALKVDSPGGPDGRVITVYRAGKKEYWQLQREVFTAVKGFDQEPSSGWWDAIVAPSRLLRWMVTHSPGFLIRNVQRDAVARAIVSDVGSKPWDIFKGFTKKQYQAFQKAGGDQAGMFLVSKSDYRRRMNEAVKEVSSDGKSILSLPGQILQGYGKLARLSELAGRMAEFRAARQHALNKLGYDAHNANLYAAAKSRDLLDFAVAGTFMRGFSQLFPFTNAAVQSLLRVGRSAKDDWRGFTARMMAYTLPMAMLVAMWNAGGDDDEEEEYWKLPNHLRDLFWNFRMPDGTWVRVPKPYELGLVSSAVERAIAMARGDGRAFEGFVWNAMRTLLPIDDSMLGGPYKAIVEPMTNWDFFREKTIIPAHERSLDVALRDTEGASRIGKIMRDTVGVDPRYIDHAIQSQFGQFGQMAVAASGAKDWSSQHTIGWLSGLGVGNQAAASRDVQSVLRSIQGRGMASSLYARPLFTALRTFRDAESGEEKEAAGRRLMDMASQMRGEIEAGRLDYLRMRRTLDTLGESPPKDAKKLKEWLADRAEAAASIPDDLAADPKRIRIMLAETMAERSGGKPINGDALSRRLEKVRAALKARPAADRP